MSTTNWHSGHMLTFKGPASIHILTPFNNITKRPNAVVFNICLLKNLTLMVEIFACRMPDLQSKVA